ncbi:MAG: phage holin family protein [Comamonadaceae bacterium]|nr:MAG: phage holin family protein [Comamonadaceae bacterium]
MFGRRGPVTALKHVGISLLSTLQTRLSLVVSEIQIEKQQVIQQLTLGVGLLFCLAIGVLSAIALAVLAWWAQRLWILGACTLLFLGTAAWCFVQLRRVSQQTTPVFAATLAELQQDLQQLKASAQRVGRKDEDGTAVDDDEQPAR